MALMDIIKKGGARFTKKGANGAVEEITSSPSTSKAVQEIRTALSDTQFGNLNKPLNEILESSTTAEEAAARVEEKFAGVLGKGEELSNLSAKIQSNFDTLKSTLKSTAPVAAGVTGAGLMAAGPGLPQGPLATATVPNETPAPTTPTPSPFPTGASVIPEATPQIPAPTRITAQQVAAPKPIKQEQVSAATLDEISKVPERLAQIRKQVKVVDPDGTLSRNMDDINSKIAEARATFETARDQARTEQDKKEVETQWMELASVFSEALVNIGAGIVGLKTGKDLSGIQFKQKDWSKEYDRIRQKAETKLKDAQTKMGISLEDLTARKASVEDQLKAQRKLQEDVIQEQQGGYLKGLSERTDIEKTRVTEANRAAEAQQRLQLDVAKTNAQLQQEADEANAKGDAERAKEIQKAQQEKFDAALKLRLKQLEMEGKKGSAEAKNIERDIKAFNEGLGILASYRDADEKSKDNLKRDFVTAAKEIGLSSAEALDMLDRADSSSWFGFFGKDYEGVLSEYEKRQPGAGTAGQSSGSGDKVRVRNPQGKEGLIPRSQLSQALTQGYTEVK